MTRQHKYENARIEASSMLPMTDLVEIVKSVAAQTTVTGFKYNKKVRLHLTAEDGGRLRYDIAHKFPLLTFNVQVDDGDQRAVRTEIESYRTSQETVLFVPVSPKAMEGYPWYRQFLLNLEAALRARDPQVSASVVERVG